ncbi:hypothetical protein V6N12_067619 [Hibiscus sabdariffa]
MRDDEQVMWRGNQLWDDEGASVDSPLRVDPEGFVNMELLVLDGQIVNAELGDVGPPMSLVGSTAEIIMYRGNRRKIRLLDEVIRRRVSPALLSGIADISISDLDFIHRQEAILR